MTTPAIQYTERRGKYNLYADPKLEKLIEENVTIGNWGKFDKAVAKLARHRKSVDGGRMRDHQRVIARQLIKVLKSKENTSRAVAELVSEAAQVIQRWDTCGDTMSQVSHLMCKLWRKSMIINYVEQLTVKQRNELNRRIAEGINNKDAFTTDADVRYFETEDYLEEINVSHYA